MSRINLMYIACALLLSCGSQQGSVIEKWETNNSFFKIRVTEYQTNSVWLSKFKYVFEAAAIDTDNWHSVIIITTDDDISIPTQQVRFVNDQIGYIFMVYQYVVTTDGGMTWSNWNIVENLPDWRRTRAAIKDVQIKPDGSGTMVLTSLTNKNAPELHTNDYGRHWSLE